jgi:uncharacterized protein (UPF0261 family)
MATVALLGTLDTKEEEFRWLRDRLHEDGTEVVLIDAGSFSTSSLADVTSDQVIVAAGADPVALREHRDRGEMMAVMGRGAARILADLVSDSAVHGFLALGGSSGSSVAAPAMQAVPVGFPKLLVSTMASGDVEPYVGESDVSLMYSVVDVAGINSISTRVLGNACASIAGMAKAYQSRSASIDGEDRKVVGLTMFGLTTPAADEARGVLTDLGYEVLVFHATGSGGRAMERLAESGLLAGVCDLTTTELADDLVGGVLTAGPHRLEAAGAAGIPQVVSVGALDMVNFGPRDTVPQEFSDRNIYVHNPTVTLMRTSAEEMAEVGRRIAAKLSVAAGPAEVFLPMHGVSGIDVDGQPFRDRDADHALFTALRDGLAGTSVPVIEINSAINDPGVGRVMAEALHRLITN